MTSLVQELRADALPRLVAARRRLRVCHIMSADLWAGAEVQVATVASYLVERPDVELTAVLLNEGPLACELRRLGVPVTVIDEQQNSAVRIFIALTRWLRGHPVDVVHTHRWKETVLGAVAARLAGVPGVIRTVHGHREPLQGWPWLKYRIYEALDKWTLLCFADRIVAVSRRMAEGLEESGYKPERVIRIHNGVDLRRVRPVRARDDVRRELGIDPATLLIGTVGRLSPVKGQAHFLRAARLILQKEPGARFLIVGDGPLRGDLETSAKRLGIDDACVFVGARTDVYDLLTAMDVFVLPSLHEGMPMALLEAMALGTPVVATAVGGVPEIVAHRTTGLLVRSSDEHGLAEACLELARDPHWARTLGARARRVVQEAFSHEQNGRALVSAYRAIGPGRWAPGALASARKRARGLLTRGARKVCDAAVNLPERRRIDRIRREPSVLMAALRSARRILIVCHGNIIRSPFAARLVAQALGDDSGVLISSAGLAAIAGTPPPPSALLVAARLHVDLGDHLASTVTPEAVATSDVIFVMDIAQLVAMRRRFPESRGKAFLLTSLAPRSEREVRDPVDGDESVFHACYEHISECIRPIVRLIAEGAEER
jgi:glycosyltransferase involved in cell wall biosynthesis/protein-tyrosine-phosphatase